MLKSLAVARFGWLVLASSQRAWAQAPVAPVRPVTDEYFRIKVVDPYRYLENLKDPEVESWFKRQNEYTRGMLARISGRHQLLERIKALDESAPARVTDVRRLDAARASCALGFHLGAHAR
jgi:prolyl oligopeptidase